jgi:YHS domain-containing protein
MKKSLVLFAVITIAFGTFSVLAVDKKPAVPAAAPAAAPAAPAADKTADAAAAPAAPSKKQTTCPKCNRKIDKKFYANSTDGKKVYFCSSFCAEKMKKDLAGAVSKLEADGIALDAADKKAEKKKK